MPSINDWAAKAAREIVIDMDLRERYEERIAAIIATFAESLTRLLREAKREHWCRKDFDPNVICTCGADAFNERIDRVLNG